MGNRNSNNQSKQNIMEPSKHELSSDTQSCKGGVIGIPWDYFSGGSSHGGKMYDRYYKAFIDGVRVEKWASNRGIKYCIGEFADDVNTYLSEDDLIEAVNRYKGKYGTNQ
jgi:hypothetical protein